MADIYVIKKSFSATLNGVSHIFRKGETVREGHEAFRLYRGSLELISPTYEYEAPPTPKPPPPPPAAVTPPPTKKAAAAPTNPAGVKAD